MSYAALLTAIALLCAMAAPVVQKGAPAPARARGAMLPAGPFLFEPGAARPTYMDAFKNRPVVKSPNDKLEVTVTGPQNSLGAWVTVAPIGSLAPGFPFRAWPIEANVDVLWRPDSQAFALTDDRYANDSYVLVFGARFNMGENGARLGVPVTDLTPTIRGDFKTRAQEFYATDAYQADLFYAKVLLWVTDDRLLVGLDARTSLSNPPPGSTWRNMKIREWFLGYVVDVPSRKVVDILSEAQLLSRYGIRVAK